MEIDRKKQDLRRVEYVGPSFVQQAHKHGGEETAKRILCRKYEAWSYEEEERIFVAGGEQFAYVGVREIVLGSKRSNQDKSLIKAFVKKVAPSVKIKNSNVDKVV